MRPVQTRTLNWSSYFYFCSKTVHAKGIAARAKRKRRGRALATPTHFVLGAAENELNRAFGQLEFIFAVKAGQSFNDA
jgi:hypothetical protein